MSELRHLKNINIEISKEKAKHLILTGKNGVGKTTILESIKNYFRSFEMDLGFTIDYWRENLIQYEKQLKNEADQEKRLVLEIKIN